MDLRPVTDDYIAAPQLDPGDFAALAQQGVTTVIDNRPDTEVPPSHQAAAMQAAAEAAGLTFVYNPVVHTALTEAHIEEQADAIAASDGKVVAYCASGTRSTIVWALGAAGEMDPDDIIARAKGAGYDLAHLAPELARRAAGAGEG
ncbi:MAG: TIGR01244 family sulfur transferase [Rhodobacteraceae bacterium]|jgi:uncharacterized protein (TIGR01244 family)|nr:TIGR01244 family sulfur transferase [Paracoccaceae bacterium]